MAEAHLPHAHHGEDPTHNVGVAHEESDVNIRGIFGFAAALAIASVFICFVVWVFFSFLASR